MMTVKEAAERVRAFADHRGLDNIRTDQDAPWREAMKVCADAAHRAELDASDAKDAGHWTPSKEVEDRFPGAVTVSRALLAEAYRGLKRTYEMPEVRRAIDAAIERTGPHSKP